MSRMLASIVVLFGVSMGMGVQAQTPASSTKLAVWGKVTRTDGELAEFSLNTTHGLWSGERVWICRRDRSGKAKYLGQMTVRSVDDTQAVGTADGFLPIPGDLVLFQKPRPVADPENPLNKLIGAYINVYFTSSSAPVRPMRALVLNIVPAADDEIREIQLTFPTTEFASRRQTYEARAIRSMRTESTTYELDLVTQTLAEASLVARRVNERARLATIEAEAARRREVTARAEETRRQEELAKAEAERSHREELALKDRSYREELAKMERFHREVLADLERRHRQQLADAEPRHPEEPAEPQDISTWGKVKETIGEIAPPLIEFCLKAIFQSSTGPSATPSHSRGPVHVHGYTTSRRTVVAPYDRSPPRSKSN
jgi:hypothetical protein